MTIHLFGMKLEKISKFQKPAGNSVFLGRTGLHTCYLYLKRAVGLCVEKRHFVGHLNTNYLMA